jgi:hypothetical protein
MTWRANLRRPYGEKRVLALERFHKPDDQCLFKLLKPPFVNGVPDRFLLLPPGRAGTPLPTALSTSFLLNTLTLLTRGRPIA